MRQILVDMFMRFVIFSILLVSACLSRPLLAGDRYALLVGISDYPADTTANACCWDNIHGANDVGMMEQVLCNHGFTGRNIRSMRNAEATAAAIREALLSLVEGCKAGDMVYIHFSCHGQLFEDLDQDEQDGWDETLVPYDARKCYEEGVYEGENHIRDDELNSYLTRLRSKLGASGMLYVVLDACHIGEAYMADGYYRGTNQVFSPSGKRYVPKEVKRKNRENFLHRTSGANESHVCMLEACHAHELNMEKLVGGVYYGALTYHVAQALAKLPIEPKSSWWMEVKRSMDDDTSLINQTLVIETSL